MRETYDPSTKSTCEGRCRQIHADPPAPFGTGVPERKDIRRPGDERGLEETQEEPQRNQALRILNGGHQRRDATPDYHRGRHPDTRADEAHAEVRDAFGDARTYEEDRYRETVSAGVEVEVYLDVHEGGIAYVGPIQPGNHVNEKKKGRQLAIDLPSYPFFLLRRHRGVELAECVDVRIGHLCAQLSVELIAVECLLDMGSAFFLKIGHFVFVFCLCTP